MRAVISLDRRAGSISGQFEERGSTGQLTFPVRELGIEDIALRSLALPVSEVRVLNRKLRQWRWSASGVGGIERGNFFDEDTDRPAVRDDVMHREEQDVFLFSKTKQHATHQRPARQVEELLACFVCEPGHFPFVLKLGQPAQVYDGQLYCGRRFDHLHGLPVDDAKARAQDFMPPHHFVQRLFQRGGVESPLQTKREGDVVEGFSRLQLIQKPEPLLRKGERERMAVVAGLPDDLSLCRTLALFAELQFKEGAL